MRLSLGVAAGWAAGALLWLVAGSALPGGRWVAVHLFTLGVLTNLLVDLTRHFAATLLHARDDARGMGARLVARNLAIVVVVVGRAEALTALVAVGATVLSLEVLLGWRDLRQIRRSALPARHTPLVRAYQRAYGAFLHAALLGALLATGAVSGSWYAGVRLAHLHVAVLGWVGVPLLATLVFFGPTLLRARSVDAADRHATRFLPLAGTGATVAALGLIVTGAEGWVGAAARVVAALGVAGFALAATVICRDVLLLVPRAATVDPALAVSLGWLVLAAWAEAAVVLTGQTSYLDVIGTMALLGGVAPLVVSSAGYLWAMSAGADAVDRLRRLATVARWSVARSVMWQAGCAAVVATTLMRSLGVEAPPWLARLGLASVGISGAAFLALVAASRVIRTLRTG